MAASRPLAAQERARNGAGPAAIPRARVPDNTLALLTSGYGFIADRCRRYHTDVFATRLMLKPVYCALGEDAARMFYEPGRFTRRGGIPMTTVELLQDKGSVALLDGPAHFARKQLFMALMTPTAIARLVDRLVEEWRAALPAWERQGAVVLDDAIAAVLCRAVCAWAGVPLAAAAVAERTREFAAMIDGAGAMGPRNWRGLLLRRRTEHWMRRIVARVRAGTLDVPEGSPAHAIAWHRDLDGELLEPAEAVVELLNILRPTVAVGRYITFAALALHEHPECRQRLEQELRDGDGSDYLEGFAQEVRRYYPFFTLIGGRALQAFMWRDRYFPVGTWFLLDLYGTNHDARLWEEPTAFRPERFHRSEGNAFSLIPQGGGDHYVNHRCPGESPTVALIEAATRLLVTGMRYDVPEQDLRIDLGRMPALPKSRFIISNVRRAA